MEGRHYCAHRFSMLEESQKGRREKSRTKVMGINNANHASWIAGGGGRFSSLTSLSFTFFFSTSLLLPKSCRARAYAPAFFDGCNSRNLPALEDSEFIYLSGKEKTKKEKKDNE